MIYLEADVDTLMSHIQKRGRDFERNISADYLGQLNQLYTDWIEDWTACPVLRIEMKGRDFQHNSDDFNYIVEQVSGALALPRL
jgi:deoxyadenosine/deoxycytidine kinase